MTGVVVLAAAFSARDHSARTAKKPVTFCDLPGVLVGEVAPEARLPDLPGAVDQIAVQCRLQRRGFIEDLTGGFLPLRAPGLRSRNPTDDAGPK